MAIEEGRWPLLTSNDRRKERERAKGVRRRQRGGGAIGVDLKRREKESRYFYVFYTQRVWFHRSRIAATVGGG